jgi:hypothetical protein
MDEFAVFSSQPTPDHCAVTVEMTPSTEIARPLIFMLKTATAREEGKY